MATRRTQISKKRKFVADGVFYTELDKFFQRELAEEGYSGVEVRPTPHRTEIIISATRTKDVLGKNGRRIRELTSVIQKRFGFPKDGVELYAERVPNRALSAVAQCESLKYKLLGGMQVRRACYGVLRFIMDSEAKGVEITVTGKLRGQRAKAMTFRDGYMLKAGTPAKDFVDKAYRHVLARQGVLGIKVSIMLPWDPNVRGAVPKVMPDAVTILEPKEEDVSPTTPEGGLHGYAQQMDGGKPAGGVEGDAAPEEAAGAGGAPSGFKTLGE